MSEGDARVSLATDLEEEALVAGAAFDELAVVLDLALVTRGAAALFALLVDEAADLLTAFRVDGPAVTTEDVALVSVRAFFDDEPSSFAALRFGAGFLAEAISMILLVLFGLCRSTRSEASITG